MDACVGVDKNTLGRETLRAVARDRISMVEVPMSSGIGFGFSAIVAARGNVPIVPNLRRGHDLQRRVIVGRRELNPVPTENPWTTSAGLATDGTSGNPGQLNKFLPPS